MQHWISLSSQRSLVGVDPNNKYYTKCTYLHSTLYKDCPIGFAADVKLCNIVYKLTCVNDMHDACVLAHTCLLKGHLASHCNVEVRIDVYRLDQSRGGSERLDLLQFDKYEHCKHSGFALSCFHSVKITPRRAVPGHQCDMRSLWMRMKR